MFSGGFCVVCFIVVFLFGCCGWVLVWFRFVVLFVVVGRFVFLFGFFGCVLGFVFCLGCGFVCFGCGLWLCGVFLV